MFNGDFVIGAFDRPYKQRPDILYGVGVNVSTIVFNTEGMVDRLMTGILVTDAPIRLDGLGIVVDRFINEIVESSPPPGLVRLAG